MQMLKIAYEEGIRIVVLTPHNHPVRGCAELSEIKQHARILRKRLPEISDDLKLFLGTEIFYRDDILESLRSGSLRPMGKSQYVLVEFSPSDTFDYIRNGLQKMQMKGFYIILAHIERYQCMLENIDHVEDLINMGVYVQINSGSITGDGGRTVKKFVDRLMKKQYVHFVGTDAHSTERRRPKMKKAKERVQRKYGSVYAEKIFYKNAVKMLKNLELYE